MKKKLLIIGSMIGVLAPMITGILLYTQAIKEKNQKPMAQSKPVLNIEIGQTYAAGDSVLKLLNDSHYVAFEDNSSYSGGDGTFPYVSFIEGTYHKEGETYIFDTQTSVLLSFLNKEYVKNKAYFDPAMPVSEIKETLVEKKIKVKVKGFYRTDTGFKSSFGPGNVYVVDHIAVPNSMDEFLSQYHYEPRNK